MEFPDFPYEAGRRRRRSLRTAAMFTTAVLAVAACGGDDEGDVAGGADSGNLTFFHYAGSNQEIVPSEVINSYMQETAEEDGTYTVQIARAEGSNARTFPGIVAAYETTGVPTAQCGYFNPDASTKGDLIDIWEPLDLDRLPNAKAIPEQWIREGNHGIAWGVSSLILAYRTDLVDPPPTSWMDLLDPKYAGHVGLPDAPLAFTFGGMVAINRELGGDDSNLDPAFEAFADAAKEGQFHSIFPGNQALKDLMATDQVSIVGYSYGNIAPWMDEGLPVDYVVPEEGQIAFPLYFQILKGGTEEQVEHCYQIINRLLDPENLARYAELTFTAPTNPEVTLSAEFAERAVFDPQSIENSIQVDWTALAENSTDLLDQWNREIVVNLE